MPWEPVLVPRRRLRTRLLVAAFLPLAVTAACGSEPEPQPSVTNGITGHVLLGPTCSVETQRSPCPTGVAAGVPVVVRRPGSHRAVATDETDQDGAFRFDLVPGVYVVTAVAGMSCTPTEATVVRGESVHVEVGCETGIR